ncbi:GntR family transcriptional regulator [Microbacterium sp. UFMG61]|uniref:GntR family transcriptional regulator n=1 Tax=Microbacterium sp. UFMG61 TaxID=2745935 RepID=UPI00188EDAB3|nr:GntR family transcriptional regulator [Microbacterium sp. UFMG61]
MDKRQRALLALPSGELSNSSAFQVFEDMLASIYDGELAPGDPVSENDIAKKYGVSRTPAREAIQRLRELGLVEASAGRTSRVVLVSEQTVRHALVVWEALMMAAATETVTRIDAADIELMQASIDEFREAASRGDAGRAAQANYDLFAALVTKSTNPLLVKSVALTVHMIRLGGMSFPRWVDAKRLGAAHVALIDALHARDVDAAKAAISAAADFRLAPDPDAVGALDS